MARLLLSLAYVIVLWWRSIHHLVWLQHYRLGNITGSLDYWILLSFAKILFYWILVNALVVFGVRYVPWKTRKPDMLATTFKNAFSWPDVEIHFVGCWYVTQHHFFRELTIISQGCGVSPRTDTKADITTEVFKTYQYQHLPPCACFGRTQSEIHGGIFHASF